MIELLQTFCYGGEIWRVLRQTKRFTKTACIQNYFLARGEVQKTGCYIGHWFDFDNRSFYETPCSLKIKEGFTL